MHEFLGSERIFLRILLISEVYGICVKVCKDTRAERDSSNTKEHMKSVKKLNEKALTNPQNVTFLRRLILNVSTKVTKSV